MHCVVVESTVEIKKAALCVHSNGMAARETMELISKIGAVEFDIKGWNIICQIDKPKCSMTCNKASKLNKKDTCFDGREAEWVGHLILIDLPVSYGAMNLLAMLPLGGIERIYSTHESRGLGADLLLF
jgi:hypothetical protein